MRGDGAGRCGRGRGGLCGVGLEGSVSVRENHERGWEVLTGSAQRFDFDLVCFGTPTFVEGGFPATGAENFGFVALFDTAALVDTGGFPPLVDTAGLAPFVPAALFPALAVPVAAGRAPAPMPEADLQRRQ